MPAESAAHQRQPGIGRAGTTAAEVFAMSQLVQAACPGCKSVLRFPSDWMSQPIRCKNCGTVMQAKPPAAAPAAPVPTPPPTAAPRVAGKTPPPLPAEAKSKKASRRKHAKAPPPAPPATPVSIEKALTPVPAVVPAHTFSTRSSPPIAQPVQAPSGRQFDFDGEEDDRPRHSARRKKKGVGGWITLAILAGLLTSAGFIAIAFWPKIKPIILQAANGDLPGMNDDEDDPPAKSTPASAAGSKARPGAKSTPGSRSGPKSAPKSKKSGSENKSGHDKTTPTPKTDADEERPVKPKPASSGTYPRRAFIISVHNYLYLNPIVDGPGAPNLKWLKTNTLSSKLNIPLNQIIHLSDAHENEREHRPPLKPVIEQGLENFLKTTRKQDRIMVFFIGHTKEVDGEAYLVPLEGEVDDVKTLIPLKWVYDQLAKCEARQKILVIDGNRYNSAQGEERPVSGPMGPKFEAALKSPPAGVQVWAACSAGQQSLQFEDAPLGLFLDSFREALSPKKGKGALEGKIPDRNDRIPLKEINDAVARRMQDELERRNLDKSNPQKPLIAGHAPVSGADYDRSEVAAAIPALPSVNPASQKLVAELLRDVGVPSLKGGEGTSLDVDFKQLPPFSPDALKGYEADIKADAKLRLAIHEARVALWAISSATPPPELQGAVREMQSRMRIEGAGVGGIMKDRYSKPAAAPAAEKTFKDRLFEDSKAMSRVVAQLEDVLEKLKDAKEERDAAPKRWQANYDYILARFQAQLAYLEDYQMLLGSLRKEYPPHDPNIHSAWRMAAKEKASDSSGKKYDRAARKLYGDLAKACKGTPWEVLAKREKLTALGLEWVAY
jgi:hypothetical protein